MPQPLPSLIVLTDGFQECLEVVLRLKGVVSGHLDKLLELLLLERADWCVVTSQENFFAFYIIFRKAVLARLRVPIALSFENISPYVTCPFHLPCLSFLFYAFFFSVYRWVALILKLSFFLIMAHPWPLFRLFWVCSNKQYKVYNKERHLEMAQPPKKSVQQYNLKKSIQYPELGFKHTTSWTIIFSHNHKTRALFLSFSLQTLSLGISLISISHTSNLCLYLFLPIHISCYAYLFLYLLILNILLYQSLPILSLPILICCGAYLFLCIVYPHSSISFYLHQCCFYVGMYQCSFQCNTLGTKYRPIK